MQYVYKGEVKPLPKKWVFKKGKNKDRSTGNFDIMPRAALIKEGWLPVTVANNEDYDPEIQTRSAPTITEFADHAELDYIVTDKPLADVKKAKQAAIIRGGVELLLSKWDLHVRQLGFSTAQEDTDMDADKATLVNYFKNTIKPLIQGAGTPLEVKNITYTWPAL